MAPTTRSSVHSRITPAPQQVKFPPRRRTTRSRKSPPLLRMRQSTLTQIDYVHTPHSTARRHESISISSDEDEDEDEYEEVKPRKRRRTTDSSSGKKTKARKRDPSQSTLTQKWNSSDLPEIKDSDEDEDELAMVDEDVSGFQADSSEPESEAHHAVQQFAVSSDVEKQSTRPTTADSSRPKTPKRITKTVIPSSNTPASVALSMRSIRSRKGIERSPLKERSVNISPTKHLRLSSSKKARLNHDNKNAQPRDQGSDEPVGTWTATLAITPKKDRKQQPRILKRTATVQDSEDDDMEMDDLKSPGKTDAIPMRPLVGTTPAEEQDDIAADPGDAEEPDPPQQESQTPLWKRTGIVQESEDTNLDFSSFSPASIFPKHLEMRDITTQSPVLSEQSISGMADETGRASQLDLPDITGQTPEAAVDDPAVGDEAASQRSRVSDGVQEPGSRPVSDNLDTASRLHHSSAEDVEDSEDRLHFPSDSTKDQVIELDDDEDEETAENDDYYTADDEDYDYEQYTYDPVQAALERDAARFGKTDTQLNAEELFTQFVPFVHDQQDDEDDGDIQEEQATNEQDEEVEVVPSTQPKERVAKSKEQTPTAGDLDDSGYGSQHMSSPPIVVEKVPSSQPLEVDNNSDDLPGLPPPAFTTKYSTFLQSTQSRPALRPSQVSTVVETQSSPNNSRPNSAHGATWDSMPPASSSPFPIPPGFSQQTRRNWTDDSQFTLTDFSLPPPPPLFSSSSQVRREN